MGALVVYDSALTKLLFWSYEVPNSTCIANGQLLSFIRFQFLTTNHCIDFRIMLLCPKMLTFKNKDGLGDAFLSCIILSYLNVKKVQ